MKRNLILAAMLLLFVQASAQTPRELWNRIPAAADNTDVCRTDTAKVRRYLESLDAFVRQADARIDAVAREAGSKTDAMRTEAAGNIPASARNAQYDAAVAARLEGMSEEQREAEGKKMAEQAFGLNTGDMDKMAKKLENATEEEKRAAVMQMISGIDLSKLGASSYAVPDEDRLAAAETIFLQIAELNIGENGKATARAMKAQSSLDSYRKAYREASQRALENFEPYRGTEWDENAPEVRSHNYRNFCNHYCPAVTPVSVSYMNANIADLADMLDFYERREALNRQLAEADPTEMNRQAARIDMAAGYECVRKYAIELKRRYESYYWIAKRYGGSAPAYDNNTPGDMQVRY